MVPLRALLDAVEGDLTETTEDTFIRGKIRTAADSAVAQVSEVKPT